MENFADIMSKLHQEDSNIPVDAVQTLAQADKSSLVNALRLRLRAPADKAVVLSQTQALATLASVALTTHERKLRAWLSAS